MPSEYDIVIRDGTVIDGSPSATPFVADVGIRAGRIVALGDLSSAASGRTIPASGRVVAPGFIDTHVHSETALLAGSEDLIGSVAQGVTTHLTAADGFGWAGLSAAGSSQLAHAYSAIYGAIPVEPDWIEPSAYLADLVRRAPVNVAAMAPHQAIRFGTLGWSTKRASSREVSRLQAELTRWLDAGALGIATGLDYQPAANADLRELVALAATAADAGGVFASHQRVRELGRRDAWMETAQIVEQTGCRATMAHSWISEDVADVADNLDPRIAFDWYMYAAGSTHVLSLLPVEEQAGGPVAVARRLREPTKRRRLGRLLEQEYRQMRASGGDAYFAFARSERHHGRALSDILEAHDAPVDSTLVDVLERELPDGLLVYQRHPDPATFAADVKRTARHPRFIIASDGIYRGSRPHPRAYGCFARFIGWCARSGGPLILAEAIHCATERPARWYGLADRGRITHGAAADIVIFDPQRMDGPATWDKPRHLAVGVDKVIVNGVIVMDNGVDTGARPGRLLSAGATA